MSSEACSTGKSPTTGTTRKLDSVNVFCLDMIFEVCSVLFSVDPLANFALDLHIIYSLNHTFQHFFILFHS